MSDEVYALRLSNSELQQSYKQAINRVAYLEEKLRRSVNPQSFNPGPSNRDEIKQIWETANVEWAAEDNASQAFHARHWALNEALQRQENYAVQRVEYECQ